MSPLTTSKLPVMAYDRVFVLTYFANTAMMVAVSLLFRYADFVNHIGGNETHLGWIVGIGALGALAVRAFQAVGIDRYGPRIVWLLSLAVFIASMFAHLLITDVHHVTVYGVRILMMIGIAGSFGASITFISLRVREERVAEMIGMLGTSGFLGLGLGPLLGDRMFGGLEINQFHINRMFLSAAGAGVISLLCAVLATRVKVRLPSRKQPPLVSLMKRYHPGLLLLVGAAMGFGISFAGTFLRAYVKEQGIKEIGLFFFVYAITAFIVRIGTRRLHQFWGAKPMIVTGLGFLAGSIGSYLLIFNSLALVLPALLVGIAHALLFPSVVAAGSTTFPARYRGLGTTLILGMFDIGVLIGQPMIGWLLLFSSQLGLPKWPTTFLAVSSLLLAVALVYAVFSRHQARSTRSRLRETDEPQETETPNRISA